MDSDFEPYVYQEANFELIAQSNEPEIKKHCNDLDNWSNDALVCVKNVRPKTKILTFKADKQGNLFFNEALQLESNGLVYQGMFPFLLKLFVLEISLLS